MYNLSIYEQSTSDVVCNIWTEAISARGAKQITSCMLHFIDEQVGKGVKEIHLVSQTALVRTGMATIIWQAMNKRSFPQEIEHCFLERGHTENENDSVHSVISRAAKNIPILTPKQWAALL